MDTKYLPLLEAINGDNEVGYAHFQDEDAWQNLEAQFDEALAQISESWGRPDFDGSGTDSDFAWFRRPWWAEVERVAFWKRGSRVGYVVLELGDNQRVRMLSVGQRTHDELQAAHGSMLQKDTGTSRSAAPRKQEPVMLGPRPCYACGRPAAERCDKCGKPFCARHGRAKQIWIWDSSVRMECLVCMRDNAALQIRIAVIGLLVVLGIVMMIVLFAGR